MATLGTWLQDIWDGRDPNATPPGTVAANDQPNPTVTPDVMRDRGEGLVSDPSRTPDDALTLMSYYTGLGLRGSVAGRTTSYLDTRGKMNPPIGSGASFRASATSTSLPMSTWVIGTLALALAFILGSILYHRG